MLRLLLVSVALPLVVTSLSSTGVSGQSVGKQPLVVKSGPATFRLYGVITQTGQGKDKATPDEHKYTLKGWQVPEPDFGEEPGTTIVAGGTGPGKGEEWEVSDVTITEADGKEVGIPSTVRISGASPNCIYFTPALAAGKPVTLRLGFRRIGSLASVEREVRFRVRPVSREDWLAAEKRKRRPKGRGAGSEAPLDRL
jgi:hypothetical protein